MVHMSDIAWGISGEDALALHRKGEEVKAIVLDVDIEKERISLGMKQLEKGAPAAGGTGTSTGGGLRKNEVVTVTVLEVDSDKRRISLGLKQAQRNPWEEFAEKHPVGSTVEGEVKNATEFGLFIGLPGDVDGMVHMSDIAWGISGEDALALHRKGEEVNAVVLDVDVEKERISLGMKQLEKGAPAAGGAGASSGGGLKRNDVVTVTVLEVRDGGLEVQAGDDGATGFIKRSDLGRDRDEQRPDRFQVGQKLDAMVIGFDRSKKPNFSIKARQIAEEKQAVEQYGSSDSGASLGDILGEALKKQ
jgi:small subunit ribosomal protein S1